METQTIYLIHKLIPPFLLPWFLTSERIIRLSSLVANQEECVREHTSVYVHTYMHANVCVCVYTLGVGAPREREKSPGMDLRGKSL